MNYKNSAFPQYDHDEWVKEIKEENEELKKLIFEAGVKYGELVGQNERLKKEIEELKRKNEKLKDALKNTLGYLHSKYDSFGHFKRYWRKEYNLAHDIIIEEDGEPISVLKLPSRINNILIQNGITTINKLSSMTTFELYSLRPAFLCGHSGLSHDSLAKIKEALKEYGYDIKGEINESVRGKAKRQAGYST